MFNILNDYNITKNFKLSEFVCHDGNNEAVINMYGIELLQQLRDVLRKPIFVAAAYRSIKHNAAVGGSPNSRHLKGEAYDIKVPGFTPRQVALAAQRLGFTGIGVYIHNGQYFTHLDVRPTPSYWYDRPGKGNLIAVKSLDQIPK